MPGLLARMSVSFWRELSFTPAALPAYPPCNEIWWMLGKTCRTNLVVFPFELQHKRTHVNSGNMPNVWLSDTGWPKNHSSVPSGDRDLSSPLLSCIQNGSRVHPTSYSVGTRGSLPWGGAAAMLNWPRTSISPQGKESFEPHLHFLICLWHRNNLPVFHLYMTLPVFWYTVGGYQSRNHKL
jgi:hypothetical protein